MWTRLFPIPFTFNALGVDRSSSPRTGLDSSLTLNSPFSSQMSSSPKIKNLAASPAEELRVDMAEMRVEHRPVTLVTNVGSCVAICIHDSVNKCGGLAHIMLPTSKITKNNTLPSKYADTAVPALTEGLRKLTRNRSILTAKIAGGANMFPNLKSNSLNIGEKNVDAVKEALSEKGIKLLAEDVMGNYGRRVTFNIVTGSVCVKNGNGDVVEI